MAEKGKRHPRDQFKFPLTNYSGGRETSVSTGGIASENLTEEVKHVLNEQAWDEGVLSSPGAAKMGITVFKHFARLFSDADNIIDSFLDITPDHIEQFEGWVADKLGIMNPDSYNRFVMFITFLRAADASQLIAAGTRPRLERVCNKIVPTQYPPREPLPQGQMDQILAAAIKDIESIKERFELGKKILGSREKNTKKRKEWPSARKILLNLINDPTLFSMASSDYVKRSQTQYTDYTLGELYGMVFLSPLDLLAFAIVMSADTGLPIESIYEDIKCICIDGINSGKLKYVKRRGKDKGKPRYHPIAHEGDYSAVSCINLLLEYTSYARSSLNEDEKGWLFVGRVKNPAKGKSPVGRIAKARPVNEFCSRHVIMTEDGQRLKIFKLAQIRKSVKADRYLRSPKVARRAGDHAVTTHDFYYANVEALLQTHESALQAAFKQALAEATQPSFRINTAAQSLHEPDPGLPEENVGVASCKDLQNSPHGSHPGTQLCQVPVIGCLSCQNAVISTSHLPAILAFLKYMIELRTKVGLEEWIEQFARPYAQISFTILPKFPKALVQRAHQIAEVDAEELYIPTEYLFMR